MVSTWLDASRAGDTETVLSLMTDDVIFLGCGRPPMRGKSAFAESQSAFAESQSALEHIKIDATGEIQEVKVLGDWGYLWTTLTVVMTPQNGAPNTRTGNTLSIVKKEDGVWRIVRDANMLGPSSK
jgi:uncharacterized protein (TIGR02246 family)